MKLSLNSSVNTGCTSNENECTELRTKETNKQESQNGLQTNFPDINSPLLAINMSPKHC